MKWNRYFEQFKKMNNSINVSCKKIIAKSNSQYGIFYEDSIIIKSILNLPIEIIDDPTIFSEEKRKIKGLKIVALHSSEKSINNYISLALEKGLFKVIPYMNAVFKVSLYNNEVNIRFFENKITVNDEYNKYIYDFDFKYVDKKRPKNIPEFLIYLNNNIKLYLFSFECEIDGLFITRDIFHTVDFRCFIRFSQKKNSKDKIHSIPKDSIIVYETKSGDNLLELEEQITIKCKFLENFFFVFPNYIQKDIIFIGFNSSKENEKYKYYNFPNLIQTGINSIILDIHDQIFGEKIYYKNEQINSPKSMKENLHKLESDVKDIKKEVKDLSEKVDEIKVDFGAKLNFIIERISQNQNQNQNYNHNTVNTSNDSNK